MRKIGYLRVSTKEQKTDRQFLGMREICDELYIEQISGRTNARSRPVYRTAVESLSRGDMLVVWDLDRAFRSAADAIAETELLFKQGIEFKMVTLPIDTTNAQGRLVYNMFASIAQFQAEFGREKTIEGLRAARLAGKVLGRPRKLSSEQVATARNRLASGQATLKALAQEFEVGRWTLARALNRILD